MSLNTNYKSISTPAIQVTNKSKCNKYQAFPMRYSCIKAPNENEIKESYTKYRALMILRLAAFAVLIRKDS